MAGKRREAHRVYMTLDCRTEWMRILHITSGAHMSDCCVHTKVQLGRPKHCLCEWRTLHVPDGKAYIK